MRPAERLLERLEAVKRLGEGRWEARCPGHDDRTPSLSISEKDDGDVLVHDHAGCSVAEVLEPIGLHPRDLFAERTNGHREIVATYDYTDAEGKLLYQVIRFAPKDFRQRRPDGNGGWDWKLGDVQRVPYRLPRVLDAAKRGEGVWIVEGEKDVHALEERGQVATCNPGGAGKWREQYAESLRGVSGGRCRRR